MAIYLTYDSEKCRDGSGAQVQRMLAIYCITKKFGLKYFRSDILDLDFNPGDGIFSVNEMEAYKDRLNEFMKFLDQKKPNNFKVREFKFRRLPRVLNFRLANLFFYFIFFNFLKLFSYVKKKNLILKVADPHPLANKIPDIYRELKSKLPNESVFNQKKIFEIHLHLVRSKVSRDQLSRRFTEDSWYLDILSSVIQLLKKNDICYEIVLHTDVNSSQSWMIPTGHNKESVEYWKGAGIKIEDNEMIVADESVLEHFKKIQNLRIVTGIDPLLAWNQIAKADLFLMGKSSFSFVGALLNPTGVIVGQKFWHTFPKGWFNIEPEQEIHVSSLIRTLEGRLRTDIFKTIH